MKNADYQPHSAEYLVSHLEPVFFCRLCFLFCPPEDGRNSSDPFRTAVPFFGTNYWEFEWFVIQTGPRAFIHFSIG